MVEVREDFTTEVSDEIPIERPGAGLSSLEAQVAVLARSDEVGAKRDAQSLGRQRTPQESSWDSDGSSQEDLASECIFYTGRFTQAKDIRRFCLHAQVGGKQLKHGGLLIWDKDAEDLRPFAVRLFENGFHLSALGSAVHNSYAWTPFAVFCEDALPIGSSVAGLPCFKLCFLSHNVLVEFTAADSDDLMRRSWLDDMAQSVRMFTQSIFPEFTLAAYDLEGLPTLASRILAGYLLLDERDSCVSVLYCVLHAQWGSRALFSMYADEACEEDALIYEDIITGDTETLDFEGIDSSCFMLGERLLCARTTHEKTLWLRNLRFVIQCLEKVSLQQHLENAKSPDQTPSKCLRFAEGFEAIPFEQLPIANERTSIYIYRNAGSPQGDVQMKSGSRASEDCGVSPSTLEPPDSASPVSDLEEEGLERSESEEEEEEVIVDIGRLQTGETESDRIVAMIPRPSNGGPRLYRDTAKQLFPLVGDDDDCCGPCDLCEDASRMLRQSFPPSCSQVAQSFPPSCSQFVTGRLEAL